MTRKVLIRHKTKQPTNQSPFRQLSDLLKGWNLESQEEKSEQNSLWLILCKKFHLLKKYPRALNLDQEIHENWHFHG